MEFSLAVMQDLAQLKSIYKEIIKNMNENGIQIWDDIYPCEFFEDGDKMEFSLAVMQDLAQLKSIYKEIIKNMNENGIQIWDDIYPCEFFEDDIKV